MTTEFSVSIDRPEIGELTHAECQERLASANIGRIAWSVGTVQHILPVSYAMHVGKVVFRTSPYGALGHLERPTNVAFEIDQLDRGAGLGWSVVVQGRAQAVVLNQEPSELWAGEDSVPWAPATRNLFISITPRTITGRRVQAPFAGRSNQPNDARASDEQETPS